MTMIPLNKQQGIIWLNGNFIPWTDAHMHLLELHSLHYSGAVFEGLKCYNGKVFKLDEHIERLFDSAQQFHLKPEYDIKTVKEITIELLQKNKLNNCYIRPLIWASAHSTKIGAPIARCNILIAAWEPQIIAKTSKRHCIVSKWVKAPPESMPPQAKSSGNYSNILLALRAAQQEGYNDALMLDWRGYIAEFTSSNVFFVKDNTLFTPIADCFLNGITRQTVIEIAKKQNISVIEKHITIDEIADYEGCFSTGTASGISAIDSITTRDETKYSFSNQKITPIITSLYNKLVGKI